MADTIARDEAARVRDELAQALDRSGLPSEPKALELGTLLGCAYPSFRATLASRPDDWFALATAGTKAARDHRIYRRLLQAGLDSPEGQTLEGVRRLLRRFAQREKMRVAARELLAHAGSDVDVTARELSDLADVCTEVAIDEARRWATERYGEALTANGTPCAFVCIGMGKLGGRELNAGSDIDLLLLYETDDGSVRKQGVETDMSLHEYFVRISQRFVSTLDDVTDDGFVWRVDLRLRPEGARGALVNSLAAAERYYESWGRTWERAALLRGRAMAGDMAFGQTALDALGPFIWRREVNPSLAEEMASLVARARVEISVDAERDLKHGHGGIREVEFFTQSLQLIWGGREPLVRSRNTIDALRRLRARGLVTDREGRDMADAYMTLRRLEHRIQFATGQQTHTLPTEPDLLRRIARSLGFGSSDDMLKDLVRTRERVAERFQSLAPSSPESGSIAPPNLPLERFFLALDDRDETALLAAITEAATAEGAALPSPLHFGAFPSPDLPRHLLALARRPDFPLGANSRDKFPHLVTTLLEALGDAADPEQASRLLAAFFARLGAPSVYARALAEEPRTARRLSSLFGASAFLGQALVAHPDLVDRLLFIRETPSPDSVQTAVDEEFQRLAPGDEGDADMFVGALRRAKAAVLMEVGLADLAGELSTRAATQILSSLADITLDRCLQFALHEKGLTATKGIAILAMGKLGGREIGYGSDLDIFFVHDGESDDDAERFARIAQRVLRLVSSPHGEGPGYELDVRLRPSGNQGVLVVSRNHFAKYHGLDGSTPSGQDWERQALIKARYCAGDPELGTQVLALAAEAAYERGAPLPADLLRIRTRMEKELAGERTGRSGKARYDLKLGKGGLVDVEFAIQWLQMRHGHDLRVRSTDTETALAALETHGYLEPRHALALREGYQFLRRLEQRLRVLHGTSANLLEEDAEGLALLARRMGMRDGPRGPAKAALLARYRTITQDVRNTYLAILGVAPPKSDED